MYPCSLQKTETTKFQKGQMEDKHTTQHHFSLKNIYRVKFVEGRSTSYRKLNEEKAERGESVCRRGVYRACRKGLSLGFLLDGSHHSLLTLCSFLALISVRLYCSCFLSFI